MRFLSLLTVSYIIYTIEFLACSGYICILEEPGVGNMREAALSQGRVSDRHHDLHI